MTYIWTLQALFRRYRRPGDIVFAWIFFLSALLLLSRIGSQTQVVDGNKLFAQPRFWPAISLSGMAFFAGLHLFGSAVSERIPGRWREVTIWLQSIEYAFWFLAYAIAVPWLGYLPSTLLLALLLVLRSGYRSGLALSGAGLVALVVVVIFKSFLHVKLPSGAVYELLPDGLRQIMLTYF
ncbi:MAG: hypothetical protein B7Z02_09800 [Rhodobacterales bacterium 32-67-9]|nr:MAG: hypothetical protein B7Z02_09800 [Rhodobacterales bacterium 32-67-9]